MPTDPATARSYLFVPATRPDRVEKALAAGADAVIVDLEDAVGEADKATARQGLAAMLPSAGCVVRINAAETLHHAANIVAVKALPWVTAVLLPKVEASATMARVAAKLPGMPILALIESARGLIAVDAIATATGPAKPARLVFGVVDYLADLGVAVNREVLLYPRSRLVVASAAAGLPAPVDGPHLNIADLDALAADTAHAKALGFGAKICIHPSQVAPVNAGFSPSEEEMAWARGVLHAAASAVGVFTYDGAMVDEPVLRRARAIVAAAPEHGGHDGRVLGTWSRGAGTWKGGPHD